MMGRITLGKLHRLSGKAIAALPRPMLVEQHGRPIALLLPSTEPRQLGADEATALSAKPAGRA
jgi:hypothetical protein